MIVPNSPPPSDNQLTERDPPSTYCYFPSQVPQIKCKRLQDSISRCSTLCNMDMSSVDCTKSRTTTQVWFCFNYCVKIWVSQSCICVLAGGIIAFSETRLSNVDKATAHQMSVMNPCLYTHVAFPWPRFRLKYVWRDEVYDGRVLYSTARDVMLDTAWYYIESRKEVNYTAKSNLNSTTTTYLCSHCL
jgi:hypothetical protein